MSSSSSRWIGGVAAATALAAASAAACGSGDRGGTSAQASCVSGDAAASACEYSGPYSAGSGYLAGAPPYCSDPDGTQILPTSAAQVAAALVGVWTDCSSSGLADLIHPGGAACPVDVTQSQVFARMP